MNADANAEATRVVWLAPLEAQGDASNSLRAWALARGVKLALPRASHRSRTTVDRSLVDEIEDALARAKDAIASLETDNAEHALAHAESIVRAHPELPNASWLLAEVTRAWATRWRRLEPSDPERGAIAWKRAAALDGGRVAGVGEIDAAPIAKVHATIAVDSAGVETRIDGVATHVGDVEIAPGEHTLTLVRDGDPIWADWITVSEGATIRVAAPTVATCSEDDFAHVRARGDDVDATSVRCAKWIAVRADESHGAIRVATCERDACGPLVLWRTLEAPRSAIAIDEREHHERGGPPAWATWSIAGAGVVVVTIAILAASGVWKSAPTETRFVNGGLKTSAAAFHF